MLIVESTKFSSLCFGTMVTQPHGVQAGAFGGIAVAFSPDATFGAEELITFMRGSLIPDHGDIAITATGTNALSERSPL